MKSKRKIRVKLFITMTCSLIIFMAILFNHTKINNITNTKSFDIRVKNFKSKNSNFVYLSDIEYQKDKTTVGWGTIQLDQNYETKYNNGLITVNIEGKKKSFMKGISAHAPSTVIYDISKYNYDYFTTYMGVDESRGENGDGVKFAIYTSTDGENWQLKTEEKPEVLKGTSNAKFVKIDIKGAKYLKLYAHQNRNNTADHAVYADAKLIKEDYQEDTNPVDFIKTVEEYDQIIKSKNIEEQLTSNELTILQREFVNSVGYDLLQSFVKYSEENKEAISWLMNDVENLRLYIIGGKPEGSYFNSIKVLSELYKNYKTDFENQEITKYGNNLGDLYKKMAITLSLTHSKLVGLWMQSSQPENQSNAVERYAIYKQMHKNGNFIVSEEKNIDITKWFEEYSVEEMRFVLNNHIDDEEILWLNEYTQQQINAHPNQVWSYLTPHPYMAYVWPNYGKEEFHDPARKDYWDQKFGGIFSKYHVTYRQGLYKVWMNFRNEFGTGAVCGGISKTGSNIRAVHGIPAAVIGQPGHAAIVYYTKDANGKGYWGIDNDVSGWTKSEKGERMLMGWGNASYTKGSYQVVYMALAQEVLNDYPTYEKSKEMVLLGQSYKGNPKKQEEIYRKALEIQPLNIDAWYELIQVYNESENKTEDDYYNLAKELTEKLKYFPLPMYQLSNLIKPKLTSIENAYKFTLLQTRILVEASEVPNNTTDQYYVYQPSLTRTEANYLLGIADNSIATFSFDGENAGKIVLANRFDGNGVRWDYSLDGKKTWKEVSFTADEEHKLSLSQKELDSITAENDIYVHIVGVNYDEENLYQIDIKEQATPTTIYNNDLENKVIGATEVMEWRMVSKKKTRTANNEGWTSFKDSEPDLTGDKSVEVRIGKTGVYMQSDSVILDYTKDIIDEKKKYVSISHLSIENVSTEATGQGRHAKNAIDGNYNTNWHSAWNGSDQDKYITIKVDNPIHLSALDYVPAGGGNGKILEGKILGSLDGVNYQELGKVTWANNDEIKTVDFNNPMKVQYIKIVGVRTSSGGGGSFIAARMFNLYEDSTKRETITTQIKYSITTKTDKEVVATLTSSNGNITITNNEGKNTYTFKENGSFTFEYVDQFGNKGTAVATVNWIIKKNSQNKPQIPNSNTSTQNKKETPKNSKPNKKNETNTNIQDTDLSTKMNKYSSGNITLSIPYQETLKNSKLNQNKTSLPDNLKEEISKEYECFELSLINNNHKVQLKPFMN